MLAVHFTVFTQLASAVRHFAFARESVEYRQRIVTASDWFSPQRMAWHNEVPSASLPCVGVIRKLFFYVY
jgi:hypothetical protein